MAGVIRSVRVHRLYVSAQVDRRDEPLAAVRALISGSSRVGKSGGPGKKRAPKDKFFPRSVVSEERSSKWDVIELPRTERGPKGRALASMASLFVYERGLVIGRTLLNQGPST